MLSIALGGLVCVFPCQFCLCPAGQEHLDGDAMRGRAVRTSWSALFLFLLVVAHQWQCLSSHRPRDTVPSRWDSQSDHTEPPLPGGFAVRPGHAVPGGRSLLRQHVGASGHCYGNRCRDHRRPKTRADQKLVSYRAPQARANSSYTCHGGLDADLTLVSVVHGIPVDAYEAITANHLNWTARWDAAYCQFQGLLDWSRPPAWSKVMALLEVLACRESPWIMWMDIDAVFASTDISVADVLRGIGAEEGKGGLDMQTKDIIFSRNYNERVALLNTGVFLLRNSGYSARFLARVYNEVTLEVVHHPWWENKAMDDFAVANRQEFYDHCMIVSPHWFNQHRMQFRSGDFVAHYAGMTSRYQRIMADLSQGILGTSDWANGTKALRKAHCGPYPPEPKELHGSQTRIRPSQITVVQSRGGLPCKPCTRAVTLHSCMDGPCLMHQ